MVTREDGFVALQHFTTNGFAVRIEADDVTYNFIPQHNVSMAWVHPNHVPILLKEMAQICCGKQKQRFEYASEINVNIWTTGDR